jgi:protein tyrosine/serine phosphatase
MLVSHWFVSNHSMSMTAQTGQRPHAFEAVRNFRDCGGYATAGGQTFRNGMLFRSGHFPLATEKDLDALKALRIATIVDLRRVSEREANPSRRWPGFEARVIARDGGPEAEDAPHLLVLRELWQTGDAPQAAMRRMYELLPFEPMIVDLMRDFLTALAEADGPVLVHCAAGKDRTGLAVALAHHVTGVGRNDMLANYLQSNVAGLADPETVARVREHFVVEGRTAAVADDAIRAVLGVAPEYLQAMLDEIDRRCGSLDGYIDGMVGISPAQRTQIVARFTS